jgi:DNA-binding protein HU-alpha
VNKNSNTATQSPTILKKAEIIDAIAAKADLSKAQAKKALEAYVDTIAEGLGRGKQISLIGLGTFYVGHREAREGRNPQTGEKIRIKASNTPKFRAGKKLKEAVS